MFTSHETSIKEVFGKNMHHYDITKTIGKAYLKQLRQFTILCKSLS